MSESLPAQATSGAQPYYQRDFPPAEFAARRSKLAALIGPCAVAVLAGLGDTGAFDLFRQGNEFYYLCGVEVPHAYLLIEGGSARTILYLPDRDPKHEHGEGPQLNADDPDTVRRLTSVDAVRPLGALAADLATAATVYAP